MAEWLAQLRVPQNWIGRSAAMVCRQTMIFRFRRRLCTSRGCRCPRAMSTCACATNWASVSGCRLCRLVQSARPAGGSAVAAGGGDDHAVCRRADGSAGRGSGGDAHRLEVCAGLAVDGEELRLLGAERVSRPAGDGQAEERLLEPVATLPRTGRAPRTRPPAQ